MAMDHQDSEAPGRDEVVRLLAQHHSALTAFCYLLVQDWELADEAVQETAVFVCARWRDFRIGTDFGAWVRSVARLRCRELVRRRAESRATQVTDAHEDDQELAADWEAIESSPELAPAYRAALAHCLASLSQRQRQVVELRYVQSLGCGEIATRLANSLDGIYLLLSRTRRRLRDCVSRRIAKGIA